MIRSGFLTEEGSVTRLKASYVGGLLTLAVVLPNVVGLPAQAADPVSCRAWQRDAKSSGSCQIPEGFTKITIALWGGGGAGGAGGGGWNPSENVAGNRGGAGGGGGGGAGVSCTLVVHPGSIVAIINDKQLDNAKGGKGRIGGAAAETGGDGASSAAATATVDGKVVATAQGGAGGLGGFGGGRDEAGQGGQGGRGGSADGSFCDGDEPKVVAGNDGKAGVPGSVENAPLGTLPGRSAALPGFDSEHSGDGAIGGAGGVAGTATRTPRGTDTTRVAQLGRHGGYPHRGGMRLTLSS